MFQFSDHFPDWNDCVGIQNVDNQFHVIRCHEVDGVFRSNNWATYSSANIRVEVYEVLLPCNSLIIVLGCFMSCRFLLYLWCRIFMLFVVVDSCWCKMQHLYVYLMWYVFIIYGDLCCEIPLLPWWRDTLCHHVWSCHADRRFVMSESSL